MKKVILILLAVCFLNNIYAVEDKELYNFINEAKRIEKELETITAELNKKKIKYEEQIKKINNLKNTKNKFILLDFVNNLYLKYYLGNANNLSFDISNLTQKQREKSNEYFTLVSLIMTEYGEKIKKCIQNKCSDLYKLYNERKKWLEIIKNYESYIGLDLALSVFQEKYDKKSKNDLLEYLDKKIIQIDQRIYLLKDEINLDILLKKNKFKTDEKKFKELSNKIKELEYLKYVIREKIRNVKCEM
jgi:hypothetical protein